MTLEEWAEQNLVVTVPWDVPVWHWTHSPERVRALEAIVGDQGDLSQWESGATGQGLHVSVSAINRMKPGTEVVSLTLLSGTRALLVQPDLFGVGFPELMRTGQRHSGLLFGIPSFRGQVDRAAARPAHVHLSRLLDLLGLPCCIYAHGIHLSVMIQDSRCLRIDPGVNHALTVKTYVDAHPLERPILVPREVVAAWLTERAPQP
jgi:hypothetical protein